jgi:hypothetical protein
LVASKSSSKTNQPFHPLGTKQKTPTFNTTKMMFSKLSIFVVATLTAFAIAAGPIPQGQGDSKIDNVAPKSDKVNTNNVTVNPTCPSGTPRCCESYFTNTNGSSCSFIFVGTSKRQATDNEKKQVKENLGVDPGTDNIWLECIQVSQGNTWYDCLII